MTAGAISAFTDENVGVLLGRADRSLVPETFSSFRFRNARVRTISVFDDWLIPSLVDLTAMDGSPAVRRRPSD